MKKMKYLSTHAWIVGVVWHVADTVKIHFFKYKKL